MHDEIIETLIPVPVFKSVRLNVIKRGIAAALTLFPFVFAALAWFWMNLFYAFMTLLLLYVLFGIIISKLREIYLPSTQRERNYSSMELAAWIVEYHYGDLEENHV